MADFWAISATIGQLYIPSSGHTGTNYPYVFPSVGQARDKTYVEQNLSYRREDQSIHTSVTRCRNKKVAKVCPKLAKSGQKVPTAVLHKSYLFQNSPNSHKIFGLLFKIIVCQELSKTPNLVTLVGNMLISSSSKFG